MGLLGQGGEGRPGHSACWRDPYGSMLGARAGRGTGQGAELLQRQGGQEAGTVSTRPRPPTRLGCGCCGAWPALTRHPQPPFPRERGPGHLRPRLAGPGIPRHAHPALRRGSARLPNSCGETLQEPPAVLGAVASCPACHTCSSSHSPQALVPTLPLSGLCGPCQVLWGCSGSPQSPSPPPPSACRALCEQASPPWGKPLALLAVLP